MIKRGLAIFMVVLVFWALPSQGFAEVSATNGIFVLYVDNDETDAGTFTVATGPNHPHPGENVLYGGADGSAWSTYLTVRSYTSGTDYVSAGDQPSSSFTVVNLNAQSQPTITPIGSTGYKTTWKIESPDSLTIEQVTNIEGTTIDDSLVRVTTTVKNDGSSPVKIGIRYEWDWQINGSDDSRIKRHNPDDSDFSSTFFEEAPPNFEYYEETNDSVTWSIFGTVNGPNTLNPPPTPPDRFNYSSWGSAYDNAWDFTVTGGNDDSAVCYYWGDTEDHAITLNPSESYTVTQYITTFEQALIPDISVNPSEVNFGDGECVNIGSRLSQTVTVTNIGTANVTIGTLSITGQNAAEFSLENDTCSNQTLLPSGSCTVDVVFTPRSGGSKSATLNIPSNLPTVTVPLTGNVCTPLLHASVPTMTQWGMIILSILLVSISVVSLRKRNIA